jgi:hypothetical protein
MAKKNDAIHFMHAAEESVGARLEAVVGALDGASVGPLHCAGLAKGVYLTGPSAIT